MRMLCDQEPTCEVAQVSSPASSPGVPRTAAWPPRGFTPPRVRPASETLPQLAANGLRYAFHAKEALQINWCRRVSTHMRLWIRPAHAALAPTPSGVDLPLPPRPLGLGFSRVRRVVLRMPRSGVSPRPGPKNLVAGTSISLKVTPIVRADFRNGFARDRKLT